MKSTVTVGTVAKPQGIRGEIKVNPLTDDNKRFFDLKKVVIGGAEYAVTLARVTPAGVFIKLDGVNDRNAAELLRRADRVVSACPRALYRAATYAGIRV